MATVSGLIRLRYPATCGACGTKLASGTLAFWDRRSKTATCEGCLGSETNDAGSEIEVPELERGQAGASAVREWQRRHERRATQIRERHKKLGGLILALSSDPQSTAAWAQGARGEQVIGSSLNGLRDQGIAVLHDRRIPGARANIDHIAISQAGVFVIDTKNYRGRVELRDVGRFKTDLRLYIGGRDRSKLLARMHKQVTAVQNALQRHPEFQDTPITPALLFMSDDNWSLLDRKPLRLGSVYALWGKALGKLIRADGELTPAQVSDLERVLATALPAA